MVAALGAYAATAGWLLWVSRAGRRARGSVEAVSAACDAGDREAALDACGCPETRGGAPVPWQRVWVAWERAIAADRPGVPLGLLLALVERESDFRPGVVRHEPCVWVAEWTQAAVRASPYRDDCCAWGSFGLTQVLFANALAQSGDLVRTPGDLLDVDKNVRAGIRELLAWRDRYGVGGGEDGGGIPIMRPGDWSDALAGYNSGRRYRDAPARTRRYVDAVRTLWLKWETHLAVPPPERVE